MKCCSFLFLSPPISSHANPRSRRAVSPLRMTSAPLPDGTALNILSFALSGPGLLATSLLTLSGLGIFFSTFELGPRQSSPTVFFLRVELPSAQRIELPNGTARMLPAGESVLRLNSKQECKAVRNLLRGCEKWSVFESRAGQLKNVMQGSGELNAEGGSWITGVVKKEDENDKEARWEEYMRLGEDRKLDEQWNLYVQRLGGFSIQQRGECKLCGGNGWRRCHRCGGASGRANASYTCDCEGGRRRCEWCQQG